MKFTASHAVERPSHTLHRRAWIGLVLALAWIALVRYPLVLNAGAHLDSDLAVDGLTLLDAIQGHWRWHYPGTPHMGIVPVIFSMPQALIWGANPYTLVSGAVVLYMLTVAALFALAWRIFGPRVACWSLLPLTFASTGMMWISARITGTHATAILCTAIALILLAEFAAKGRVWRAAVLGLWCGFGLYADGLMLLAVLAIGAAFVSFVLQPAHDDEPERRSIGGEIARGVVAIVVAGVAFWIGYQPHEIGKRLDPHDPYGEQFESILKIEANHERDWKTIDRVARQHARLMALECLPRLIGGHRLPSLEADPAPESFDGRVARSRHRPGPLALVTVGIALVLGSLSLIALLFFRPVSLPDAEADRRARYAVVMALVLCWMLYPAAFVLNKHIYNSDNFRYLVILIIPLALGSGLLLANISEASAAGRLGALLFAVVFGLLMSQDTLAWYQALGWVDSGGRPMHRRADPAALHWLEEHPEIDMIYGDYWDVYRLSFLSGGRVQGLPYKYYPDRFGLSARLKKERPPIVVGRPNSMGLFYRQQAMREGGRVIHEEPSFWIIEWP